MGLDILGFVDSEFIPWPEDFRDEERFATEDDQFQAAEMQPDLLDWTGGDVMWFPSQALLPEAWNHYASPSSGWSPVADDPRVEDVRGAVFVPSDLLHERLPAVLRFANEDRRMGERLEAAAMLRRIVDLARTVEGQGHRLLFVLSL